MHLTFPNLDTLQLAITSGTVPETVSRAAAQAEFAGDGSVRVRTAVTVSKTAETALKRLGVGLDPAAEGVLPEQVLCWPQLLPLQADKSPEISDRLPVLLELDEPGRLTEVVSEMLRLGNDRQAVRWIGDGSQTRALLRVVGPPFYTLLRAIDRSSKDGRSVRAFVERGERVWVEFGATHPLAGRLKPPSGKMLVIRRPRDWQVIEDGRFQDIYSLLEFTLPDSPAGWQPVEIPERIRVPLRLAPSDSTDPAELWVLSGSARTALDELVQSADDQLLSRLSFAVGENGVATTIVLRARPGKSGPPVLVLDAQPYRPYLKLPNLFVPCTSRLHPPLRRDVVKKLLAEDAQTLVWLEPEGATGFRPRSLPDLAFRPLQDWVDYVLDQEQQPLRQWMESMQFEFEPFVCRDGDGERPARPPIRQDELQDDETEPAELPPPVPETPKTRKAAKRKAVEPAEPMFRIKPNELRQKLLVLEREMQTLASPLDAGPQHQDLWVRMAQLNAALDRFSDAAVCAGNALWTASEPPPETFWNWARPGTADRLDLEWTADKLDRVLTEPSPSLTDVTGLAAYLAWTLFEDEPLPLLDERLAPVQQFLEKNETHVGVRLLWLAWLAVYRRSDRDVLTLARARDRILERLFQNGLSPDLDLPSFLRYSGSALNDRLRVVRDHVLNLRTSVGEWYAREQKGMSAPETAATLAYVDLMFAYALARLGETPEALSFQNRADKALLHKDLVHTWLAMAFVHRIQQALEGKAGGQLPGDLLSRLPSMERMPRYVVDRLRERSRILEPHEKFNPYRTWTHSHMPPLERELATLCDVLNRDELLQRLRDFLSRKGLELRDEISVIATALDLAPRLGDEFAGPVLDRVGPLLSRTAAPVDQVRLLERGLFVAAHYDHPQLVQEFVARFRTLISGDLGAEVEKTISSVLQRSFFGLRKLGMRDETSRLLEHVAERVRRLPASGPAGVGNDDSRIVPLRLLLQVAAGWMYFGQEERARPILDEARTLLLEGDLPPRQQTDLACSYLATLGQAPPDIAVGRMTELFRNLENIRDTFTTNSHYSQAQLRVVEEAVLALISDDVALDKTGRRWLDDDEYLVRKRIHADVRAALA